MVAADRYPTLTVKSSAPRQDGVALSAPHVVTAVGSGLIVKGHVTAVEHLIVEGEIEGTIVVPDHGVAISGSARVRGEVCARTITVLGRVDGSLTASALIELRATAVVTGRLAAPLLSMEEGARFRGSVHRGTPVWRQQRGGPWILWVGHSGGRVRFREHGLGCVRGRFRAAYTEEAGIGEEMHPGLTPKPPPHKGKASRGRSLGGDGVEDGT